MFSRYGTRMRNAAKRHLLRPTSRAPGAAKTNLSAFVHKKKRAHKDAFLFCEKMILFIGGGADTFIVSELMYSPGSSTAQ